ncbi:ArpU family phage packaging/lysis transcriptional regulator [Oenococcus sp.]|uniref:ArpU family phage packaging/lysis transcriptional regulator n=1 Tax=Oenococcus sp. TaxID=1979414 RepID=UPI0039EAE741
MDQIDLLDQVDYNATIENVRSFFKHNRAESSKFERLLAKAGSSTDDLKSQIWSAMPKAVSIDNSQEIKVERRIMAKDEANYCIRALLNIPWKYRRFLVSYYVDNPSDKQWTDIALEYGFSRTGANDLLNKALLWFADAYLGEHDFHIYTKCKGNTDCGD